MHTPTTWPAALEAAGFTLAPTYGPPTGPTAGVPTTARHPDGWIVMLNGASVAAWGPDGLALTVPPTPDVPALLASASRCQECGAHGPTVRLGFAGRACPPCRARLAPVVEHRGWCD